MRRITKANGFDQLIENVEKMKILRNNLKYEEKFGWYMRHRENNNNDIN